jgi:hypothetical protein
MLPKIYSLFLAVFFVVTTACAFGGEKSVASPAEIPTTDTPPLAPTPLPTTTPVLVASTPGLVASTPGLVASAPDLMAGATAAPGDRPATRAEAGASPDAAKSFVDIEKDLEAMATRWDESIAGKSGWFHRRVEVYEPLRAASDAPPVHFRALRDTWVEEDWYRLESGEVTGYISHVWDADGGVWLRAALVDGYYVRILPVQDYTEQITTSKSMPLLWSWPDYLLPLQAAPRSTLATTLEDGHYRLTLTGTHSAPQNVMLYSGPRALSGYSYEWLFDWENGDTQLFTHYAQGAGSEEWFLVFRKSSQQVGLVPDLSDYARQTLQAATAMLADHLARP